MDEIRSWWQVPSIAHFCSLFRSAFGLTDFEIEDLEDALMISGGEEDSRFLADLLARLLRGLFSKKADINADNFEPYLSEVLKVRWVEDMKRENPLESTEYRYLSTREKVEILHGLCDWRLDVDDVAEHLKGMEADSLRVEPLGRDSSNNVYWYFYGTRLYKECVERSEMAAKEKTKKQRSKKRKKKKVKKKKKGKKKKRSSCESESESSSASDSFSESEDEDEDEEEEEEAEKENYSEQQPKRTWSLVCSTKEEWETLAEAFSSSKSKEEKALHQTLTDDFLAEIARMLEVKDKAFRKKLLVEMAPRRSSDRIAIKAQQKEEEDKMAEFEKQQQKERLAEIKKQEAEEREKERQIQAEKRQRERAERARLREERQWLIANGGDVPEELLLSLERTEEGDEDKNDDENKLDELDKAFEGDIDMFTGMYKVLDGLKNHEDGWPFLEPVDESYAPQYFDIVTTPMDLSTIEKKIDNKQYKGLKEFISDVKLMFTNCLDYNGEESSYTQMAHTLESVFDRQMKKHFPDDDNQSSDDDFEEELTETELRKLNQKNVNETNGMDDLIKAVDIHRSNQDHTMPDHRIPDPNMFARHFGMMPMSNGVPRPMAGKYEQPNMPGAMAFGQQMPYPGQLQSLYGAQMYPGPPAFARFNMNELARGGGGPMFPAMMGMPHPGMTMNTRAPAQFPAQEMQMADAAARGIAPVATKGESSASMWTDNRMQDIRSIGHPYPRHPLSSPNSPWQTGVVVPNSRQMLGAWRASPPAKVNGVPEQANGSFGKENGGNQVERYPLDSNNDRRTAFMNRGVGEGERKSGDPTTSAKKPAGTHPSENDLRFPFIMAQQQQQQQQQQQRQRRSNEGHENSVVTTLHTAGELNTPSVRTFTNTNSSEGVSSPAGRDEPRAKTPPKNVPEQAPPGKVLLNLDSVKQGQSRNTPEKRANPYSVSSIIGSDEQRSKRPSEERLKYSTLLQEMSQGRKPEGVANARAGELPAGMPNKVAQFMDLNTTRNQMPPSLIRQPHAVDRLPSAASPSESHQPSMFGSYSKHVPTTHSPLNPSTVVSPSPFMDMRTHVDPGHMLNREGHSFDPRTLYQSYSSRGELQRQQMLLLQQQQQQQMLQIGNFHPMNSMVPSGIPRTMPQEYAFLAQRPVYDAMIGRYKNGEKPSTLDELTAKKSRVS